MSVPLSAAFGQISYAVRRASASDSAKHTVTWPKRGLPFAAALVERLEKRGLGSRSDEAVADPPGQLGHLLARGRDHHLDRLLGHRVEPCVLDRVVLPAMRRQLAAP